MQAMDRVVQARRLRVHARDDIHGEKVLLQAPNGKIADDAAGLRVKSDVPYSLAIRAIGLLVGGATSARALVIITLLRVTPLSVRIGELSARQCRHSPECSTGPARANNRL